MSIPGMEILGLLSPKQPQPPPQAAPVDPNATIGLDPETMLKAEQAFSGGPNPQLGQSMVSPAPPTQPPPFVPDQPAPPPIAAAPGAPPAAAPGLGDQTLPLDESAPSPAPPSAPPTGADVSTAAQSAPAALGPPPTPPPLTGDPAKDSQANLEYHRQLTAYSDQVQQHGANLAQQQAGLNQKKADRELQMEQNAATIRNDEAKRFATENAQRRAAIDKAVTDKTQAYGDLSKGNGFLDQSLGDKVMGAIIFMLGSRQQALMNVAMIQSGHAPTAQNEGLNYINKLMEQRYQQKKDRLAAANDSVLEARYGFKDALENHQAAIADLDADAAANYRLAAKEAASQGAQLGSEQARQAGLQAHAELMQKSAEYEQKMLQEQATLQEKREAAGATNKLAEAHLGLQERQIEATQGERQVTNAIARGHLTLAQQEAETRKAEFLQKEADRKEAAAGAATVGSVRQNAVLGNLAEAEKAVKDVGEVPIDAINKLQKNEEQAHAAKHSAESGALGNLGTNLLRGAGVVSRGRYDGIPEDQQKKITAAEQVITHLTEMQQGKNIETLEQYRDRYSPYVPGLSKEEVRRREAALPGLVAEQRAIQDPKGTGAKRTAGLDAADKNKDLLDLADKADKKKPALPPGAKPAVKNGRQGIILNGQFYPKL
jgi:hypothetical protein